MTSSDYTVLVNKEQGTRRSLKVFYGYSNYRSHRRMAEFYRKSIQRVCELVDDIDSADLVILHYEPYVFTAFYAACPILYKRYVIGYCVWEASALPDQYVDGISLVQEVWTCSKYCRDVFSRYHHNVQYIPHTISRDIRCRTDTLGAVRCLIGYSEEKTYFLTITKIHEPRKNVDGLLQAFAEIAVWNSDAILIVKCLPGESIPAGWPARNVIVCPQLYTDEEINALYLSSSVYVSAHHSEGWGLPLSDALLFDLPLIATGYSGNLDFMGGMSSYPINSREMLISDKKCSGMFTTSMAWGEPDLAHMVDTMKLAFNSVQEPIIDHGDLPFPDPLAIFSPKNVERLVNARLMSIANYLFP